MMWSSQNVHLYNGIIVIFLFKQILFKSVWQIPLPSCDMRCIYHIKCIATYFLKEQTILILTKYNHKCTKEINLLSSRRFSKTFLNDIQNFLLKLKNIGKFGLNYHRYSSTISFAYFEVFFLIIPTVKNFFPGGGRITLPPTGGVLPFYIQKLCMILLFLLSINVLNFKMIGLK